MEELGGISTARFREGSPFIFIFFEKQDLFCFEILKEGRLRQNWKKNVSFKNPNTHEEEKFECVQINYLEKSKIILLGGEEGRVSVHNIENGNKIADFLASGQASN